MMDWSAKIFMVDVCNFINQMDVKSYCIYAMPGTRTLLVVGSRDKIPIAELCVGLSGV